MLSLKKLYTLVLSVALLMPFASVLAADSLTVYTSIMPQKYFIEKIGGDKVDVQVLVSPGKSPATYEPTPQQIMGLGNAAALFTIGVPFEKAFVPSIEKTLPQLKIVDTSQGIKKRTLEAHDHHDEDAHREHGHEHEHEEHEHEHNDAHHDHGHDHPTGMKDPHIWLSPRLVKIQANTIYQTLVAIDAKNTDSYKMGYDELVKELDTVDAKLTQALAEHKGKTMFVFHPAFGYFADDYGLHQVAIETGGKEPAPAKLEQIIEHAKAEDVHIIFVQPEFSKNAANSIAQAIDGAVVTLSPLNPDYTGNLLHIADELNKAFK